MGKVNTEHCQHLAYEKCKRLLGIPIVPDIISYCEDVRYSHEKEEAYKRYFLFAQYTLISPPLFKVVVLKF